MISIGCPLRSKPPALAAVGASVIAAAKANVLEFFMTAFLPQAILQAEFDLLLIQVTSTVKGCRFPSSPYGNESRIEADFRVGTQTRNASHNHKGNIRCAIRLEVNFYSADFDPRRPISIASA